MKDIEQDFTKPENLVIDACAGTFPVANTCMFIPKQRRPTECELSCRRVTDAMAQPVPIHARRVLSKEWDIDDEEGCGSAKVYDKTVEAIEVQKSLDMWAISEELPSMQMFS